MDLTCLLWAEACRCKSDVSPPEGMRSPTDQAQHCPPHHQPRGDHLQGEEEFLINKYASNPSQERTGYTSFAPTEATKPPAAQGRALLPQQPAVFLQRKLLHALSPTSGAGADHAQCRAGTMRAQQYPTTQLPAPQPVQEMFPSKGSLSKPPQGVHQPGGGIS